MTLRELMTEVARERGLDDEDIKTVFERASLRVPIPFDHVIPPEHEESVMTSTRRMMDHWSQMSRPQQVAIMQAVENKVAKGN